MKVEKEDPPEMERHWPPMSPEEQDKALRGLRSYLEELQRRGYPLKGVVLTTPRESGFPVPMNLSHEPSRPVGMFSRLLDGRILWMRPTSSVVWDGKAWVPAKGVTIGASMESKPLTNEEIADLISKGILGKE